jgi:Protein of unknown function (DUF2815)
MTEPVNMEQQSVVLRDVTIVYPNVFKPTVPKGSNPDATPAYSVTVLLPPGYDMTELNQILFTAATRTFGSDAARFIQSGVIKSPYRNQAEKAALGKEGFSAEPGAKYINVKSERQPGVVDQTLQPVLDPTKVYGGKVCNVQVSAFAWNHPTGGKGVSFSLQNIQLVRDGPRLGNANPDPKTVFKPLAMPEEGVKADKNIREIFG